MTQLGDCFLSAYRMATADNAPPGVKLVHGIAQYRRPGPDYGKPFWHAWVEVVLAGVPMVVDFSNGNEVTTRRDDYYRIGGITQVFRYTQAQARRHGERTENAGPWVDDWESYEHPDFHA